MTSDHNQRLGFEFDKRKKGARDFDEFRKGRKVKSTSKQEIRVNQAKDQLLATGKISEVLGVLGGGKEATVLLARENNKSGDYVCAKVFRYYTSTIRKRLRGTKHMTEFDMAHLAARQEYWNLVEMHGAGILVPKPLYLWGNITVMEYITANNNEVPAPLLREVDLSEGYDPEDTLYEAIDILAEMFLKIQFIHGDYSEHNLMMTEEGRLMTMDVSQSVQYNQKTFIDTPVRIRIDRATKLLETDIHNINQHFHKRYRMSVDIMEVKEEIIQELPEHLQDYLNERTIEIRPSSMLSTAAYLAKQEYWCDTVRNRSGRSKQKPK
ncbi:MAG: RIO1 family regulatory kinase/ATPase domain-containing protein [Candidatus Hodarchaeales archaeon]